MKYNYDSVNIVIIEIKLGIQIYEIAYWTNVNFWSNWLDIRIGTFYACLCPQFYRIKTKPESVWKVWSTKDVSYGKDDTITLNLQIS